VSFSHLTVEVSSRIRTAQAALSVARGLSAPDDRVVRGLIYVILFGAYEWLLKRSVSAVVSSVNSHAIARNQMLWGLLCMSMDAEIQSFRASPVRKVWAKAPALLRLVEDKSAATVSDVFPSDGSFMKPSQLQLIWALLELPGDPWPDSRLIGRITEIREARNDIAHGENPPEFYGSRITDGEMKARIDDMNWLFTHIITSLSKHFKSRTAFIR